MRGLHDASLFPCFSLTGGGRVICCCSPREVRGQVGASVAAPDQNRGQELEHDINQLPLGQHTHFVFNVKIYFLDQLYSFMFLD